MIKGVTVILFRNGDYVFRKIKPKRPVVIRNGNTVKVCYYFQGTKTCLGPLCYWLRIGKCNVCTRFKVKKAQ